MKAQVFDGFDHKDIDVPETFLETVTMREVIPGVASEVLETKYHFHHKHVIEGHPIYWAEYLPQKNPTG